MGVVVKLGFHLFRRVGDVRRSDRLVRFLRVFGFGFVFFRRFRQILVAEILDDDVAAGGDCFFGEVDGVGTHISDQTVFI